MKWVKRLEEEMFRQGDQERVHNLPISPLMDRLKGQGITKSQTGVSLNVHISMKVTDRCELGCPRMSQTLGHPGTVLISSHTPAAIPPSWEHPSAIL